MASLTTFTEIFGPSFFFSRSSSLNHMNIPEITDFIYLLKNLSFSALLLEKKKPTQLSKWGLI